jgi:Hypervirulence associated proteins TUDOR domain
LLAGKLQPEGFTPTKRGELQSRARRPDVVKSFRRGDHVRWNSEAGIVSGVIVKTIVRDTKFKGYVRHASEDEPQYFIKSDKTDHVAVHKGSALRLIGKRKKKARKAKRG